MNACFHPESLVGTMPPPPGFYSVALPDANELELDLPDDSSTILSDQLSHNPTDTGELSATQAKEPEHDEEEDDISGTFSFDN
jgi:hypothetical protein